MTSVISEEPEYSSHHDQLEAHIRHLQHTLEALIYSTNLRAAADRREARADAQLQLDVSKEWTADLLAQKRR